MTIDNALLDILQCPACQGTLVSHSEALLCQSCGRQYSVCDGVPDLRFSPSGTETDDFNKEQAEYEGDLHDRVAPLEYEKAIKVFGTKSTLMAEGWAEEIARSSPGRVLDYGSGVGLESRILVKHFHPVFAFDISPVSIGMNVKQNAVLGCIANAFSLPFKDKAFDSVCICGVLHHIVDLSGAISELARVTRTSVFLAEGVPRSRPGFGRGLRYPGLLRKILYLSYVLFQKSRVRLYPQYFRRIPIYCRRLVTFRRESGPMQAGSCESKHERPLDAEPIVDLFERAGFAKKNLQYWTNLDYPGDGPLKRLVTSALVNDEFGTHFDLHVVRRPDNKR